MAVTLSPCRNNTSFRASDRLSSESWSRASIRISRHQPLKRAIGAFPLTFPFCRGGWDSPSRTPIRAQLAGRATPLHEGERISLSHVFGVELFDVKSRRRDEIIDLAVEMTTAAEAFPTR